MTYICQDEGCGEVTYDDPIPATGHSWGDWEHNDNPEEHIRVCQNAGCTETKPHIFPESWIIDSEATEGVEGSRHRNCTECGYSQTETIPALGHTHKFNNWVEEVSSGCTESGTKAHYRCTCGKYFDETHNEIADITIPATGHTSVTVPAVAPTCTQTGLTEGLSCSVCNAVITAQTVVPAKGHSWGGWSTVTPATEENDGEEKRECSVCHEEETQAIPALSHTHTYENWVEEVTPSCTESGTKAHYLCTCGKYFDESHNEITDLTIPATGHNWGGWSTVTPATEENNGEEKRECSVCREEETRSIPALNHTHTYENWVEEVAAGCTESGTKAHYLCTCGKFFDESHNEITDLTIPATGHTPVTVPAVAPTCTQTGLTEGSSCSVCNAVITAQEEVPATGHAFDWKVTKQPTKDETGLKILTCKVCEATTGEPVVIAKLVSDAGGNGGVIDLEPDNEYELEILVKPTNSIYNVDGVNVGYEVALWIVVDGERTKEYDSNKTVTLMLRIPDEMVGKDFELYKVNGIKLDPVQFTAEGNIVTIRTTLSAEIVFHTEQAPEKSGSFPWWIILIVAAVCVVIIIIVIVVVKKKNGGNGGTPAQVSGGSGTVIVNKDDPEMRRKLAEHDAQIAELLNRDDGGFGDTVELDEKGNIKK